MNATIYLEGGGDSDELKVRCRAGFRALIEKFGIKGRNPRLVACGGREKAFDRFCTKLLDASPDEFVALLIDSEDPVKDVTKKWAHLKTRDNWDKPESAKEDQIFFMATCMESWIIADKDSLIKHYGNKFLHKKLPSVQTLEQQPREAVLKMLEHATKDCQSHYEKGDHSFKILEMIEPSALKDLHFFEEFKNTLRERL